MKAANEEFLAYLNSPIVGVETMGGSIKEAKRATVKRVSSRRGKRSRLNGGQCIQPQRKRKYEMLKNLLLYRLLIINAIGASLVVWAWSNGRIDGAFSGDAALFCSGMSAIFIGSLFSTFIRASKVSEGLNDIKEGLTVDASKFSIKNSHIGYAGAVIVAVSLIGNVDGMTTALQGFISADQQQKAELMAVGMAVAFSVTKIGLALGTWTGVNFQILKTATALLVMDARHVR